MDIYRNRIANSSNPFQGDMKRVLCVCSAGLLRSPTAAYVLSNEPFGFNTRAAGCSPEYALIQVDPALIAWAQEIVVMEEWHKRDVVRVMDEMRSNGLGDFSNKKIHVLSVPDTYGTRDPELIAIMTEKLSHIFSSNSSDG